MLVIAIDRDSVHAGDDLSRHASSITLDPSATLRALFEAIRTMHYLPSISGDDASWIICASGKQMGVLAQQWSAPRLTVPIESLLKQFLETTNLAFYLSTGASQILTSSSPALRQERCCLHDTRVSIWRFRGMCASCRWLSPEPMATEPNHPHSISPSPDANLTRRFPVLIHSKALARSRC